MIVMALTTLQPMKPIHIFGAWNWAFSLTKSVKPGQCHRAIPNVSVTQSPYLACSGGWLR